MENCGEVNQKLKVSVIYIYIYISKILELTIVKKSLNKNKEGCNKLMDNLKFNHFIMNK